jgi:hypothetical protein
MASVSMTAIFSNPRILRLIVFILIALNIAAVWWLYAKDAPEGAYSNPFVRVLLSLSCLTER